MTVPSNSVGGEAASLNIPAELFVAPDAGVLAFGHRQLVLPGWTWVTAPAQRAPPVGRVGPALGALPLCEPSPTDWLITSAKQLTMPRTLEP